MAGKRRKSRQVSVGSVVIGGGAPISVQSMTKTHTDDVVRTVRQIRRLEKAGCEIVRVAVPTAAAAEALSEIKGKIAVPLVADIHFRYDLALRAIARGVDAVRINPGNMRSKRRLREVVLAAGDGGIPIRIGVNSGSIRARGEEKADLVRLMVDRALEYCDDFERWQFRDIILSLKASTCMETMEAYREVAKRCDYPLHIGLTAAGPPETALVKSAIAIGGLLSEGIGDTIRVSFTGRPEAEVRAGIEILRALGLRKEGIEIISCPTCGRCEVDIVRMVRDVQSALAGRKGRLTAAIMGCVVNGPGEAREADVGIACGRGFGFLFKRGRKMRRIPEKRLVRELLKEIDKLLKPRSK